MDQAPCRFGLSRRAWTGVAALIVYCVASFLYFGLRVLIEPGEHVVVGTGADPQIFIWSFAWWPHALLNGDNPFVAHAIWAPDGINITWRTSVAGLALLFSPVTLLAGPFAAYDVAAVLLPAFAAWTAFLLCRHLTGSFWPSLVGGYLFGFSSYVLGQELGHPHLTAVFLIPLVVLVVVRYLEGELGARALALRLGPLLALQLLFSTEVTFTLALAGAAVIVLSVVLVPRLRRRLVLLFAPLVASCVFAAVLTAPFLYYALRGFQANEFHPPATFVADLLNFAVPTNLALSGGGWAAAISNSFPDGDAERGAYLGLPALCIVGSFAGRQWKTPTGRLLLAALALSIVAALGSRLTVDGHRMLTLPWALVQNDALFDNVLTVRLALYVSLVTAVIVALWTASRPPGVLGRLLPSLAVLALVPNPTAGVWATRLSVPPFFTDSAYRSCLDPGENILPIPVSYQGESMLWQVASDFRFTMAGGNIGLTPPASFSTPYAVAQVAGGNSIAADQADFLRTYIRLKDVTSVVVDEKQSALWVDALNRIATPQHVGGVILYQLATAPPACPGP